MVKYDISVGYIIINDKKEYLLLRKSVDGIWDFPKGHFKEGETVEQDVALRELQEETGIKKKLITPIIGFRHEHTFVNTQGITRQIILFLAMCNKNPTISKEHTEYVWARIEDAKELMVYPEKKTALDAVANYIRNN